MTPRLIVDCGGRVLSALLVNAAGELVPWSQEIHQIAARHVSMDVLFDPVAMQDRDFIWEDALDTLTRAGARGFFARARRLGLRRPWDPGASANALQLASPLAVLSSAAALADRSAGAVLPRVGSAMLGAILDPLFAFVAEQPVAPRDLQLVVIVPANTGRAARTVLRQVFRRRGWHRVAIVHREIATAMALVDHAPCECAVLEMSENDLHVHRVAIGGDPLEPRFHTVSTDTIPGLGRTQWMARLATALQTPPSAAFDRSLTTLLTGSPDSLPMRTTHAAIDAVAADAFAAVDVGAVRRALPSLPLLFAGELFLLEPLRRIFGTPATGAPLLEHALRSVALATQRRWTIADGGSLRVNTARGEAHELIPPAQIPTSGETSLFECAFRVAGDPTANRSFLVHLLWGADHAPNGNATLCALPVEVRDNVLRLAVQLRRSRSGRRVHGSAEVYGAGDAVIARAHFSHELEVMS
jgi:hypothetical protein